jgi:hypothetical protein
MLDIFLGNPPSDTFPEEPRISGRRVGDLVYWSGDAGAGFLMREQAAGALLGGFITPANEEPQRLVVTRLRPVPDDVIQYLDRYWQTRGICTSEG